MFQDGRRTRLARVGVAGAAALLAVGIAACTSSSGSSSPSSSSTASAGAGVAMTGQVGAVPDMATGAEKTGTVTVAAPPNSAPTWILPLVTGAADSVYDVDEFDYQTYRPLYWLVNGTAPTETPSMSLAEDPVWSNNDKTVTITLKSNYKWSNGQPVTSAGRRSSAFDETKAALKESPANWYAYSPGLGIPDEVASISTPNAKHGRDQPDEGGEPDLVLRGRARLVHADAVAGVGHRRDRRRGDHRLGHQPGRREEDLRLPERAVQVAVHLRDQPAVAGGGRSVQALRVQLHHR